MKNIIFTLLLSAITMNAWAAQDDWKALDLRARELYSLGKYDQAVVVASEALAQAEKKFGPEHPDVAPYLNNLALLYYTQGEYKKAEVLYRRSLDICQEVFGTQHRDVATCYYNLALLYHVQKDYEKAERCYKRSIKICEEILGSDHAEVASGCFSLADLYYVQDFYDKAEPLYKRSLKIWENDQDQNADDLMACMEKLAAICHATSRDSEAVDYQRRADTISDEKP